MSEMNGITTQSDLTFKQTDSLIKQGLFLKAKTLAESNWGDIKNWHTAEQIQLAVSIHSHIGSDRTADFLILKSFRQNAQVSDNIEHFLYYTLNKQGPIIAQELFEKYAETLVPLEQYIFQAILNRLFANYELAETFVKLCEPLADSPSLATNLRIANLIAQDKFSLALELAQTNYQQYPKISSLRALFNATQHAQGLQQAVDMFALELPKYESASLWLNYASYNATLLNWQQCQHGLERYKSLIFTEDKHSKATYNSLLGQSLLATEQVEQGISLLSDNKSYYWQAVIANISNYPDNKDKLAKKILDVPFIRQKHLTCAPTTMAAIANYFGDHHSSDDIASQICFDGTPDIKERQWLLDNGYSYVEFQLDQAILVELINQNIPFSLITSSGYSSHMQAVIGYNLVHGTMYIMDPSTPAMQEMLIKETIEKEGFRGARCLAFIQSSEQQKLDFIQTTCRKLFEIRDKYQRARQIENVSIMQESAEQMRQLDAEHNLTLYTQRDLACYFNDVQAIQSFNQTLLNRFPNEITLIDSTYFCLRDQGERQQALEQLEQAVESTRNLNLTETLFNEFFDTNENPQLTEKLLKQLKQLGGNSPSVYFSIANYLWENQEFEKAFNFYFISHCLDDTESRYVESYFKAANIIGKSQIALDGLKSRYQRYQYRSPAPAISLYNAYCLINKEADGIVVLEDALQIHPKEQDLITELAYAYANYGALDKLESLLRTHQESLSEQSRLNLTAKYNQAIGDLTAASNNFQAIYKKSPFVSRHANAYFQSLSKLGNSEQLDKEIEQLACDYPNIPNVYFYISDWHSKPNYIVEQLDKGCKIRPDNWYLKQSQINNLIQLNRYSESLEQAQIAHINFKQNSSSTACLAKCYYYCGNFEQARELAQKVLSKDIDNSSALWVLSVCGESLEQKQKDLSFVKQQLDKQHSIEDGIWHYWTEAQHQLSEKELQPFIDMLLDRYHQHWFSYCIASQFYRYFNKMEQSLDVITTGQKLFPLTPRMHSEKALIQVSMGDITGAIVSNNQALAINPAWDTVAKAQSELYEQQGELENALDTINKCLKRNQQDGILHGFYADIAIKLKQYPEALKHLKLAIKYNIDYPWGWENLLSVSETLGCTDEPHKLAQQLALSHSHASAVWRFHAYLDTSINQKKRHLQQALKCDPMDIRSYADLIDVYTRQGEFTQALNLLDNTPWKDTLPTTLAETKADLLLSMGREQEAEQVLCAFLFNRAGVYSGWRKLYEIYHDWAENDKKAKSLAVSAAEKHISLNPHDADALCLAAEQILSFGDKDRATQLLKRAYELNPNNEYIMLTYVDRVIQLEDYPEALEILNAYEQFDTVSFALARKVNVLVKLAKIEQATSTFRVLVTSKCDTYQTLNHAYKALKQEIAAKDLLAIAAEALENCSKVQAYWWADKSLELTKLNSVSRLMKQIQNIKSAPAWAGAFTAVLDYWNEHKRAPDNKIVQDNFSRIILEPNLATRLLESKMGVNHYYEVVHIMDSISEEIKAQLPMSAYYQHVVCLLMLKRHKEAQTSIELGLQAPADYSLHNLLVWHHADQWMNGQTIAFDELEQIDKRELVSTEVYVLHALKFIVSLQQLAAEERLSNFKSNVGKLKYHYKQVSGLAVCDTVHKAIKHSIKELLPLTSVWQRLAVNLKLM